MSLPDLVPTTSSELARWVGENAQSTRQALSPVGGRTALSLGFPPSRPVRHVDLTSLQRVIEYPARDMTITVEAGLRVGELQRLLATEGQQLPIDIAQAERATIGGALASNTSGPRRFGYGTFRDYLIGVSAIDAQGRLFKAGGRVVKNVAGYDLCKLLVGSRGSLAIITQVTLKLKPVPSTLGWWWLGFDTFAEMENVLERLMTSAARPVALEMLDVPAAKLVTAEARLNLPTAMPVLALFVEGSERDVEWQLAALRKEIVPFGVQSLEAVTGDAGQALLQALTDFQVPTEEPLTFQANLRPSRCWEFAELANQLEIAVQCHAGSGVVVGQLPETAATLDRARLLLEPLRQLARAADGNLIILHCDPEWRDALPMCGDSEPSWPLMRHLKQTLDPQQLLNPGQFLDRVDTA